MGCYLCGDRKRLEECKNDSRFIERPEDLQYCPVCGTPMYVLEGIDYFEAQIKEAIADIQETCTDEEGNVLIVERIPWKGKPMDMTIDLDKINIDREVCMMEKAYGEKPWTTEYARQRIREQIMEYLIEKQEKGD